MGVPLVSLAGDRFAGRQLLSYLTTIGHADLCVGSLDAYVEHLTITAVAGEGFWGWWKAEPGFELTVDQTTGRRLPDPAGYFCALRAQP